MRKEQFHQFSAVHPIQNIMLRSERLKKRLILEDGNEQQISFANCPNRRELSDRILQKIVVNSIAPDLHFLFVC